MSSPRVLLLLFTALAGVPALPAQTGPLFPEPFRVEHHVVQDDGDGSRFVTDPVVDTYGGSWLVSERSDGSRLIVDFARREVSEVDTGRGIYWTVGFSQLGDLMARAARGQGLIPEQAVQAQEKQAGSEEAPIVVEELPALGRRSSAPVNEAWTRTVVRRFRVSAGDRPEETLELWIDPTIHLAPAAQAAIASFESELRRGAGAAAELSQKMAAAARTQAGGGFTVRQVQAFALGPLSETATGRLEDVTTRIERVESLPLELVTIPEGLARIPHPLEQVVRFLAGEEERRRMMSGVEDP